MFLTFSTTYKKACFYLLYTLLSLYTPHLYANEYASSSLYGTLGLNTVPSARMEDVGTIRFTVSTSDPYVHGYLGLQLLDNVHIAMRQSAETSSINAVPNRFYPGFDMKFRLFKERLYLPEISLGLNAAYGHKRFASEYISATKRWNNFDITGGMAWGRLGQAAHLGNPLGIFGSHFNQARTFNDESPNKPNDWFTGKDIGFFAGIEYFTPINGLSIKADYGAEEYVVEQINSDYDPPAPWAIGLNYTPASFVNVGTALIGGDKIMGHISLKGNVKNWNNKDQYGWAYGSDKKYENPVINHRNGTHYLSVEPHSSTPKQLGIAAHNTANQEEGPALPKTVSILPQIYGLRGQNIRLLRQDIANKSSHISPQEIWQNTEFANDNKAAFSLSGLFTKPLYKDLGLKLHLNQDLSLTEEDSGILFRTSLILDYKTQILNNFILGSSARVNLAHNLNRITDIRPRSAAPVRSDVDIFAENTLTVDTSYLGWLFSINPNFHLSATAGVLEEMYSGYGGEILYRPFGKTYAIGGEIYRATKRDPFTQLALGSTGRDVTTGLVTGYYEIPNQNITLSASIGQYLAEDFGGTVSIAKNYDNGVKVSGFATMTDMEDQDLFNSTSHFYSGFKLSMPIGQVKYVPEGSTINLNTAQLGRDTEQSLNAPLPLYELTEPLSYRHMAQNWSDIQYQDATTY